MKDQIRMFGGDTASVVLIVTDGTISDIQASLALVGGMYLVKLGTTYLL